MRNKLPQVGEIFEQRYKLLEVLGSGGFGTLFKTRQTDSGRIIALKVLPPHIAVEQEFRDRFFREAQALSKLNHENIVNVYHLGLTDNGLPYLAMELVDGLSLRKILAEVGSLNEQRTLWIMLQVCRALTCMHEAGIIHRDLKPDNIMLSQKPEPDTVKIVDFGLAKTDADGDQKLTATGVAIGSINYMSPEQCQGKTADLRSDIYSAAICMYEMLAGEPPFLADSAMGVMYKHVNEQPEELHLSARATIAESIRKLIGKGLEKEPNNRFQSAADMYNSLLEIAEQLPQNFSRNKTSTISKLCKRFDLALATIAVLSTVLLFLATQKHPVQRANPVDSNAWKTARRSASVYLPAVKTAETELSLKRAVTENERVFGPTHPKVGTTLLKLGTYYLQTRKWGMAEEALKRALNINTKCSVQNTSDAVAELEGLGICSMEKCRFVEAEDYFKSAIKRAKKDMEPKMPE